MNLDAEMSTHTGMECQSKSSHKYLLLQVWCGLLTVTMVVMAAFLTSIKSKSTEDGVSVLKDNPTPSPTGTPLMNSLKSVGPSFSYIQLMKSLQNDSWEVTPEYNQCSLVLHNDAIHCKEDSIYFIYAQVTFTQHSKKNQNKKVTLKRHERPGKKSRDLVVGTFPNTTEGSVWVAKIVKLQNGDAISIVITGDCLKDHTFWGAYQLH